MSLNSQQVQTVEYSQSRIKDSYKSLLVKHKTISYYSLQISAKVLYKCNTLTIQ